MEISFEINIILIKIKIYLTKSSYSNIITILMFTNLSVAVANFKQEKLIETLKQYMKNIFQKQI